MTLSMILNSISQPFIKIKARFPHIAGYGWGIASMWCLSTCNYFVKQVSKEISPIQTFFFRSVQITVYCFLYMLYQNMQFHYKSISINRLLLVRGVFGGSGMILIFYALQFLPLSDATVLTQIYPIFTGILAAITLGEKYELNQLWSALICLIGVIFIAQPPAIFGIDGRQETDSGARVFGTIILVCASGTTAIVEVLVRKIGVKTNVGVVTFVAGIVSALISSTMCLFLPKISSIGLQDALYLFYIGVLSFGSQIFRGKALVIMSAGRVANTAYFGVLNAFLIDIFIIGTEISFYSVMGALCISLCLVIYIWQIYRKEAKA